MKDYTITSLNQLMQPRYKVIADYPLSHLYFNVGDILEQKENGGGFARKEDTHLGMHEDTVSKFPHLFKKLKWWQEREVEDLPKYVKYASESNKVLKVLRWRKTNQTFYAVVNPLGDYDLSANEYLPATEEEYNSQKQNP